MIDIDGKEINIDDEVILSRGSGVIKAKITKETKCHIYFKICNITTKQYADWSTYIVKGMGSSNMYKI